MIIKENTRGASRYKIYSYNEHRNRFTKHLESEGLQDLSMHEFDADQADAYRDYMDDELDLSVKTINGALSYLTKFWKYAKKKKWCTENPFTEVERMYENQKKAKEKRFEYLTPDIEKFLVNENPRTAVQRLITHFGRLIMSFCRSTICSIIRLNSQQKKCFLPEKEG